MILSTLDEKSAPWSEPELKDNCPECESKDIDIFEIGEYKGKEWITYICNNCSKKFGNEPEEL